MDAILATKRFSQLGGLQLDRDVRALVAYAGELTQRSVRDRFAELTQVCAWCCRGVLPSFVSPMVSIQGHGKVQSGWSCMACTHATCLHVPSHLWRMNL